MLLKDLLEHLKEQNLQIPDFSIKKNYIDKLNDIRQYISQYNRNEACWFKFQYIFNVCDHVRIYKYKINFAKDYTQNFFEESLVIRKDKSTVPRTYIINNINCEEIVGTFYQKGLENTDQKEFRVKKIIKRKDDKIYVTWKGYKNFLQLD